MKFTDLSRAKQQLLKAFTEGEAIQIYYPHTGWIDALDRTIWAIDQFPADRLQVKPKEPVVTYRYQFITKAGNITNECSSLKDIDDFCHSSIIKTFHDGMFIKAEIVQE